MNKLFIGLFSLLTIYAGISTLSSYPVSQGDSLDNLAHKAALLSVTRAAAKYSIRNGSTHISTGGYSYGGGYSSGSYRGGK